MSTPLQVTASRLRVPVTDADHIRGPVDAPATLVEYGDYQCPHCGLAHRNLVDLLRQRPDGVRLVFRHFPLTNVHPYAEDAAETAEAAGTRGCFWPMHDWIFEHQDQLDPVHLSLGMQQIGLPADEIGDELGAHEHLDRIRGDFVGAIRSGVNAAPTFFLNGVRYEGTYSVPDLLAAVDKAAEG
ncbi:DsbA family protein [Plantactinospora sp. CA-290183]|uniref:DsbA family protein n=1 Tax=Plantactinospora sp. CA-290183 TaxID=3240006 RepID=UPI003D89B4BD